MRVSIIIPVVREDKVKICLRAIKENAGDPKNYEVITEVDRDKIGCPKMLDKLVKKTKYDLVMFLGDDTVPQDGFLKEAVKKMSKFPDGWGVVGLSTEDPGGWNEQAHFLAHKKILEYTGGEFYSTDYKHCFGEHELRDIATELDRFAYAEKAKVLHDHPINSKGDPKDEHLIRAYAPETLKHDQKTYWKRKIKRNKKNGMRLGIGWPITNSMIHANFVFSFNNIKKGDYDFFVPHAPGSIAAVRNDIVVQALHTGVTHLWFTDTDQTYFDADTLEKLISHKKPIVSVPVFRRYPPFDPIMFRRNEDGSVADIPYEEIKDAMDNKKTLDVDITGMGSVFFDMEVFTNIDRPWFELPEYGKPGLGEDTFFWKKANEAGYSILTDCSINVEHLTTMGIGYNTYVMFNTLLKGNRSET